MDRRELLTEKSNPHSSNIDRLSIREILEKINLTSDGMPLSEEIKIEVWKNKDIKCLEVPVRYHIRVGEVKLNTWNDGVKNLWFLFTKR